MTWALESYKKLKTEQLTGLPLFKQRGQTRRASNGQASATSIGQSGQIRMEPTMRQSLLEPSSIRLPSYIA